MNFFEWNLVLWGSDKMQLCKTTPIMLDMQLDMLDWWHYLLTMHSGGKFSGLQNTRVEFKLASNFNILIHCSHAFFF